MPPPGLPPATTPADDRRVPWHGSDLFLAVVTGAILSMVLMVPIAMIGMGGGSENLSFADVSVMGMVIYASLCFTGWYFAIKRRGASLADARLRPVTGSTLLKMLAVTIGMMVVNAFVVAISGLVFGDVPTAQDQVVGGADSIAFGDFIWLFVLGAIAAPLAEEFLFRGLLYPLLRNRRKVVVAVGVSALAFALLHMIPALVPALLVMGIVLAVLVERYDSLYPAIAVHALNNAVALIGLYAAIGTG